MSLFDTFIVQPIFNLLVGLYTVIPGGDFGVAIIIFTVFVRFAIYPLTRSMLHQSRAMRKLQPQLQQIKKKAKGNRQLESLQMMELYKEHGVKPFRSILILLIQLPIFIALYSVIQIFTLHRDQVAKFTYDFLEGIPAIKQIIEHPDQFNEKLFGFVDLVKPAIHQNGIEIFLIILAAIAGYTQYIMSKQTMPSADPDRRLRDIMAEAAEGKQADQSEMNAVVMRKMSKFLPFIMFFVMISVPGALALYFAVSNLVAVAQQSYLLRQDEDELETLAETPLKKETKSPVVKRAEKATEATVTRVVVKSSSKKKRKK
ncbi:MAG: YidC/Oxa1 family membrane protein insertase [Candidatus Saccharimonadales bacterium]